MELRKKKEDKQTKQNKTKNGKEKENWKYQS